MIANPPVAFYCNGADYDYGVVPGRLGANSNAPYTDPYGTPGPCAGYCTASSSATNGVSDGYTASGQASAPPAGSAVVDVTA